MTSLTRRRLSALAVGLALAAGPGTSGAQEIRALFLWVVDGAGFPVLDLQPEEVEIVEDGRARFTVGLERVDWPTRLTILVDNSEQMIPALGQLREGLRGLVDALPPNLTVELLTTAPQPRFVVRSTADFAAVRVGIDRITPDRGQAAFVDGLVEASDRIRDDDSPHFSIVLAVAGNGIDPSVNGGYERKVERLIAQTVARPATYHAVVWMDRNQRSNGLVTGTVQTLVGTEMARMTGGAFDTIAVSSRLATLLPELGERIAVSAARQGTQYRVTYTRPPDTGAPDGIRANLFRLNAQGFLSLDGRMP